MADELLEREGQIRTLESLLDGARAGAGVLVWVVGEAGSGKTSLVNALASAVGRDVVVVRGACDPLATPRPVGPVLDLLEELAPDFAIEDKRPLDLFNEVLARLRARDGVSLVVIEDLHWGDDATFDFIRFLGRRVNTTQAVVLCTFRDDEVTGDHPLGIVLGQLATNRAVTRVRIPPLSVDAVRQLAAGHAIDPVALHRVTGGNAFYVTEVIASGADLPETVQEAVLARIALLGLRARRFVEAIAVSPGWLELDYAERIARSGPADLEEALGSGVIILEQDRLQFRHEIAREAVSGTILPLYRLEMHRKLIEILAGLENPPLARLSHHAGEVGDPDLIARYVPRAAEAAAGRSSLREAVALYELAASHTESMTADELAGLRLRYAAALRSLGFAERSREQATLAANHYRSTGQHEALSQALGVIGTALWDLSDTAASEGVTADRIAIAEEHGLTAEMHRAFFTKSWAHMLQRQYRPAREGADRLAEMAASVSDRQLEVHARMLLGTVELVVGDPDSGIRITREALASASEIGWVDFLVFGYTNLGSGAGEARRYDVALEGLDETIRLGSERDRDLSVGYSTAWKARIAFEQARYEEVSTLVADVEALVPNEKDISRITALGALGRTRVRLGEEGGRQTLEAGVSIGIRHELQHVWPLWCGIAEHSWLWGDPETVKPLLAPVFERALGTDSVWARGEVGFWMWRVGAIDGPPDGAAEPFALQMSGDWKAAAETWDRIGCPYEVALALMDGDRAARLEALHIFDTLGALPAGMKLRAMLRESGETSVPRGPIRTTAADPWKLTPKQRQVAELVAEGLSNAEIADRLFISKKTVEHHVAAVFQKLQVANRNDITRLLKTTKK